MKKEFDLEEYKRREAERDRERQAWNIYMGVRTWRFFVTLALCLVVALFAGLVSCFAPKQEMPRSFTIGVGTDGNMEYHEFELPPDFPIN